MSCNFASLTRIRYGGIGIVLLLLVNCGSWNFLGETHYEEISRIKSPDGVVEAVLVRGNGGATTGFTFQVFLVPNGMKFDEKAELFKVERAVFGEEHHEALELVWRDPKFLEIKFKKARIFRYINSWQSQEVQNSRYIVEIRLTPLDPKSSLIDRDKNPF